MYLNKGTSIKQNGQGAWSQWLIKNLTNKFSNLLGERSHK